jgi:selenocysteine-specific elongation factor
MSSLRRNIMLGTAGHVDHGKSALVKLLTGCETDTLAEEKQRGLTIDLGFAPCRLADARIVGVVDVPGHVDFIRNMVAGAHGIDVAILVVAADDGIMPQTHEHLHILTLMGLRRGLVALTKVDLVEPGRLETVPGELTRLLGGTFLAGAPICPVSNVTGAGFEGFFDALNLVVNACEDRPTTGVFRVWVDDAFTIRGSGTVVTGIPTQGVVHFEDRLTLWPSRLAGHVRRMQVYGQEATLGRAGECVALNLPELDYQLAHRGMVLSTGDVTEPVSMAEAYFETLGSTQSSLKDYDEVQLHIGTAAVQARLAMLEFGEMTAGQSQMVQVRLPEALPLIPGERFVVRANLGSGQSGLTTVGGGRILGTSNTRLHRRKQWTIERLSARRAIIDDAERWCELMLRESSDALAPKELEQRCRSTASELAAFLDRLRAGGTIRATPAGALTHSENVQEAESKIIDVVQSFHAANAQRAGVERDEAFRQTAISSAIFDLAIESLLAQKRLVRHGTVLSAADWAARLPDADECLCRAVAAAYQKAGWAPPAAGELAVTLRAPVERIEKMMRLLLDRAELVRLDERVVMHRDSVEAGQQTALRLFRTAPTFSTMQFRDALGVSRKFAVPLLDYLDKARFTVRRGHDRTPGAEAKRLLQQ